jgi:hypothetical protein
MAKRSGRGSSMLITKMRGVPPRKVRPAHAWGALHGMPPVAHGPTPAGPQKAPFVPKKKLPPLSS